MKRKSVMLIGLVLVVGLLFTGPTVSLAASNAQKGELRVALPETLDSPDPHGTSSMHMITIMLARNIFDTLVRWDPATREIVPMLATSWESIDPTTWKFNLRDDVKFHDGTSLTSEAVKISFDRVKELAGPIAPLFKDVVAVETPNDYTVIIKTSRPLGALLVNLSLLAIAPPSAVTDPSFSEKVVGSGPFKLTEWVRDVRFVLEGNEDYWREGIAKLAKVTFYEIPETTARLTALRTGEVDLTRAIPAEDIPTLETDPEINVITGHTYTIRVLWVNAQRPPFDDVRVRQALWYAIDRDTIIETLFEGDALPARSVISSTVYGFSAMPPYPYDPGKAKELLTEAGYPDGFRTALKYHVLNPKQRELAETIGAMFSEVGIAADLVLQPVSLWIEDLLSLDWDMNLIGNNTTVTGDPDFTLNRLYHSTANRTGFESAELDRILDAAAASVDPAERAELYKQVQELLWEKGIAIIFFENLANYAYRSNVKNFVAPPDELLDLSGVYVEGGE